MVRRAVCALFDHNNSTCEHIGARLDRQVIFRQSLGRMSSDPSEPDPRVPVHATRLGRSGYLSRAASLLDAMLLSHDLLSAPRPVGLGAAVEAAFDALAEVEAVARDGRAEEETRVKVRVAGARNRMLTAYGSVVSGLDVLIASGVPALAAEAREVAIATLGARRPQRKKLSPSELEVTMKHVVDRLSDTPGLRARLEALVRPELVQLLLDRYAALTETLDNRVRSQKTKMDVRRTTAMLNDAINHYATCVLATAPPGDAEKRARAEAVLRPIVAHRARARRKPRARKKRG